MTYDQASSSEKLTNKYEDDFGDRFPLWLVGVQPEICPNDEECPESGEKSREVPQVQDQVSSC